ncbi:MAG: molybdopterin-dependent oxidoreductase [Vibrio sp.]
MAKECIKSACPYCGVGCGVEITPKGEIIGDKLHPANQGALCVKGSALAQSLDMPDRLLYPKVRNAAQGWNRQDWSQITETIAEKLHSTIQKHGADSVAMYVSGQLLTEDYYVANKLMKGYVGSANIDTNSRLCMSSAVAAHIRAFGEDLVPVTYDELNHTDLIVLVGANTAWTHPILFRRIQQAREANPKVKLVVIDPRKTITAEQADLHLQIDNDGDVLLFMGLMRHLLDNHQQDEDFIKKYANGFDALATSLAFPEYEFEAVHKALSVRANLLETFYQWFAESPTAMTLFCQGVNQSQSGTDKANTIINAHLMTGKIGKQGAGPFSITGQPNAMGGREVGGLANQLAVHRGFDSESIAAVQKAWQAPNMATKAGLKAVDLFQAIEDEKIKFLWIMATNPAVSMPNSAQVRRALEKCDFVVVSDITSHTDTAHYADVLLPAAGWGEKAGMVTNSERCLTRQRQFIAPQGEAKPDWWMVAQVGKLLCQKMGVQSGFEFASEADVFREYAQLTGINTHTDLQLDLSSLARITDKEYASWQPKSWPFKQAVLQHKGLRFHKELNALHFPTANGKANFVTPEQNSYQSQNSKSSWWLNSGRQRDQWHTMTRTGHISHLAASEVEPTLYMNPIAAEQAKLSFGHLVKLSSCDDTNSTFARLAEDKGLTHQQVFMSMHWAGLFGGQSQANKALHSVVDPHSGQPAFKSQTVRIQATDIASYGLAIGLDLASTQPDWCYQSLQHVDFAQKRANSTYQQGVWRFADQEIITKSDMKNIIQNQYPKAQCVMLDLDKSWCAVIIRQNLIMGLVMVSSEPIKHTPETLLPLIREKWNLGALLSVLTRSDGKVSKLVCSCFRVTEQDILDQQENNPNISLRELQQTLRCGTNCGSCLPEVKGYLQQQSIDVLMIK